jgi:hypothetical protein
MKTFLRNNLSDVAMFVLVLYLVFSAHEKFGWAVSSPLALLSVIMFINSLVLNDIAKTVTVQVDVLVDLIKNQNVIIHNLRKELGLGEDNAE